jgi:hypothetical protein
MIMQEFSVTLLCDIKSNFRRSKNEIIYGKKGEKVLVVGQSEDVYLVELNGERFSVHKSKIYESE